MNQGLSFLHAHSLYSLLITLKNQMETGNSGLKIVLYQVL